MQATPRMHISPLARESLALRTSAGLCAEAKESTDYLNQFSIAPVAAADNRLIMSLRTEEGTPLPHVPSRLTPRNDRDAGRGVRAAMIRAEVAAQRIKPFTHGETTSGLFDTAETGIDQSGEIGGMHMGYLAKNGLEVYPNGTDCRFYTVAKSKANWFQFFESTDATTGAVESELFRSVDIPAANLPASGRPQVVCVVMELLYGEGVGYYDPNFNPPMYNTARVVSASFQIFDPFIYGRFDYLPKLVYDVGYPAKGIHYHPIAFVEGPDIYQCHTGELYVEGYTSPGGIPRVR